METPTPALLPVAAVPVLSVPSPGVEFHDTWMGGVKHTRTHVCTYVSWSLVPGGALPLCCFKHKGEEKGEKGRKKKKETLPSYLTLPYLPICVRIPRYGITATLPYLPTYVPT